MTWLQGPRLVIERQNQNMQPAIMNKLISKLVIRSHQPCMRPHVIYMSHGWSMCVSSSLSFTQWTSHNAHLFEDDMLTQECSVVLPGSQLGVMFQCSHHIHDIFLSQQQLQKLCKHKLCVTARYGYTIGPQTLNLWADFMTLKADNGS